MHYRREQWTPEVDPHRLDRTGDSTGGPTRGQGQNPTRAARLTRAGRYSPAPLTVPAHASTSRLALRRRVRDGLSNRSDSPSAVPHGAASRSASADSSTAIASFEAESSPPASTTLASRSPKSAGAPAITRSHVAPCDSSLRGSAIVRLPRPLQYRQGSSRNAPASGPWGPHGHQRHALGFTVVERPGHRFVRRHLVHVHAGRAKGGAEFGERPPGIRPVHEAQPAGGDGLRRPPHPRSGGRIRHASPSSGREPRTILTAVPDKTAALPQDGGRGRACFMGTGLAVTFRTPPRHAPRRPRTGFRIGKGSGMRAPAAGWRDAGSADPLHSTPSPRCPSCVDTAPENGKGGDRLRSPSNARFGL